MTSWPVSNDFVCESLTQDTSQPQPYAPNSRAVAGRSEPEEPLRAFYGLTAAEARLAHLEVAKV
jgi:hypothetical protein